MTTTQQPSLASVVAAIQQRWGDKALRRLAQVKTDTDGFSTGYAPLDRLLGRNGVPRGTLTCLSGHPTSGMTTLALNVLACAQADGEVTVYIDAERTLDPAYAAQRGINLDRLLVVWPQPRALGLDIARDIIAGEGAGVVVFDLGQAQPGTAVQPGAVTRALRRLIMTLPRSPYALLCLSAASDGLNAAVVAYADLHLCVERQRWQRQAGRVEGYEVRVTALKNRFAPPGQSVTFTVSLDHHAQRRGP
jgi:recombination protein RecA